MSEMSFDLDAVLVPISEDQPCGTDPRLDESPVSPFRQVKDKREEARRAERQALATGEDSVEAEGHWRIVRRQGLDVLTRQAKDLEIAAFVLEALLRLEGPAGLADGLLLCRRLVESFWGQLYPLPDEDGIETTLLPLSRLNGDTLTAAMQQWEVTGGVSKGPYKIWQHRQALDMQGLKEEEKNERVSRGAVSMEDFERAVLETQKSFFVNLMADMNRAREELRLLSQALDERAGHDAPSVSKIDEGLEAAQGVLRMVAGDLLIEEEVSEGGSGGDGTEPGSIRTGGVGGSVDNSLSSREDAFRALLKIADFLEKLEPQSLLPTEIRKVVRRGRMKPEELYRDLIMDESILERLFRDVGLQPASAS